MTVLMFGWEFPPHITGGLGTACFGLTKSLFLRGMDIIFVVPKLFGDENTEVARVVGADNVAVKIDSIKQFSQSINSKYIEINSKLVPYQTDEEYFRLANSSTASVEGNVDENMYFSFSAGYGKDLYSEVERYAIVASQIARDFEFDIIHCHDWLTYKSGIEAKKISRKPLVVHVHATEIDRSGYNNINSLVFEIEKSGMDEADKIVCVSQYTKDILVKYYHQDASKIAVVHNGIDKEPLATKHAKIKKTAKLVTFLGRITHQKGPEYFVDAAAKILAKDRDVHFVMVGSGDLYNKMVEKVAEQGLADRFHFTGFLNQVDVNKILSATDVYVMPSVSEPFGISALEALENDVPIVISKQTGVGEVVNNALKANFWDTDSIADSIYALLNYKTLKNTMVKECRRDLEHLSWEAAASKLENLYNQLLS